MARNKPTQTGVIVGPTMDDWKDDALIDFDNGAFNRAVGVLLGIIEPLPCDNPTGIDRNNARRWRREYQERLASRARSRAKRDAARLRNGG